MVRGSGALRHVVAVAVVACAAAVAPAHGAVSTRSTGALGSSCSFLPAAAGDWSTPANWTCGHVPTTSDQVSVGSGQTAQIGAAADAGDLTLDGGTIQFTASVGLDVAAVASQSAGTLGVTAGTISGAGTVSVGGTFSKTTAGQLTIENAALMLDDADPAANSVAGGTLTVNGTVSGTVTLTDGGVLNGTGQTGSVVNTSGTVSPGTWAGTLTIAGDYTQGAAGTLTEEIASGTQFDRIVMSGSVMLDGTLAIQSGGFTPAPTDAFKIIAGAASRSGTFATVTGAGVPPNAYAPRYDTDGVTLFVVPTNTAPPSIPSNGHPGDLVTCDPGTWTGSPAFTFVWTSDGTPIAGQTGQTYTLASGDVGHAIRCSVAAHNGVDSAPVDSNALTVTPPAPTNSAAPSIPGSGHPGDVVTCNPGTWTGAATITYAWTRDGTVIAGQTGSSYALVDADAGHTIRCRVTAHNAGGDSAPLDSNGLSAIVAAPTSSAPPSIPATGHTGDKITCSPGAWSGSPTFTFAWTRDGTSIAGQTAQTYTLADADAGHTIRCRVTAHNAGGDSAPLDSSALGASIAVPKNSAAPSIPNTGRPGDVVTCNAGTWTGAPTLTYAWLRNDVVLQGQTGRRYTLTNNDVSQEIRCRVAAHNAGGDGAPADSNALAVVKGSAVGGCAICIVGAPSRTNLTASGTGSIVARTGSILIDGKVRVTGSGKITAASIGMYPRASTKANFKPARPVALVHPVADPLASRSVPSVTQPCRTSASTALRPGVYCGLDVGRRHVTLAPGLYVFTGTVQLGSGGILSGRGVTIFLAHGSLTLSSGSTLDVAAATSGPFSGIAIALGRKNGAALSVAGYARATVHGAIYGRAASLSLAGSSALTCTGGPIDVARLTRAGKSSVLVRPGV